MSKRNIIKIDLSGCKNGKECEKVIELITSGKVKIIVDCLARISSSRHHRKYNSLLLRYLDQDGRRHICYGTDG